MDNVQSKLSMEEKQSQIAARVAGVFSALSLMFAAFSIYYVVIEQHGRFDFSDQVLMPVAVTMLIVSLASFWLIRHKRLGLGARLLFFFVVLLPPLAAVLVLADFGFTAIAYIVFMSWIMIQFVLPRSARLLAFIAAFVTIVLCTGIELLDPAFRIVTAIYDVTTVLIVLASLTILAVLGRQYRSFSLRTKLTLAFSITSISVVLVTTFIFYTSQRNDSLASFRNIATSAAGIAALQQNGDEFAHIASAQDPLYEKFRVQNLKIRRSSPQFVYVFTASRDDQGFYFVVDAGEPGEANIAAFGARYDDPSVTLANNYDTMTSPLADPDIYTDQYGSFLSAYAPIFTAAGQRVGVIGVDIDASTIVQKLKQLSDQTLVIILFASVAGVLLGGFFGNWLTRPVERLTADTSRFAAGDFSLRTTIDTRDEIGQLSLSFNQMADQIQTLVSSLEDQVTTRTEELRASGDVGRAAASSLDTDQLLSQIVNLIVERFGLYYAAVFTLDKSGQTAVLREASGEAGRILKEQHHQLTVGGRSMVGQAILERRARIALDVGAEAIYFANPVLPDTRSEIALPLIVGERVLGALDAQSTQTAAFSEASAAVLQSMADQIAVALSNAEQFTQTDAALRRARDLYTASQVISAASEPSAVLSALINHVAPDANRGGIMRFGPREADGQLSYAEFVAAWVHPDYSAVMQPIEVGTRFTPQQMPLVNFVTPGQSLIVPDVNDPAFDPLVRGLMQRFGAQALVALPLTIGPQMLGIVVVGYRTPRQFDVDHLQAMQTLTGQTAIVLQNIQSATEARTALAQLDAANRRLTGEAWDEFVQQRTARDVRWISSTDQAEQPDLPEVTEALSGGQVTTRPLADGKQLGVAVPIKLRDVPIGAVRLVVPQQAWVEDMRTALESIAGHVAQAAENARLLQQTERDAQREKAISGAADKIHRAISLDTVLQTAIAEINRITGLADVSIQLGFAESTTAEENGHGAIN